MLSEAIVTFLWGLASSTGYALMFCVPIIVAEYIWPAGPHPTLRERVFNFAIWIAVAVLLRAIRDPLEVIIGGLVNGGWIGLLAFGWTPKTVPEIIASTLAYAFVYDFFQYWFHRAQHRFALLWPAHALHHDDRFFNATTSLRNTVWTGVLGFFVVHIPTLVLCGNSFVTFYGSLLLFYAFGFWNHANLRVNMGPLNYIISNPQWHRTHHLEDAAYHNRNYAAFFPVLDLVFGTYKAPPREMGLTTGLGDYGQSGGGGTGLARAVFGLPPHKSLR
jgi:sterol desaturase/sphingolipid hydroxylase (fatty acid hydroxylase superfamily)